MKYVTDLIHRLGNALRIKSAPGPAPAPAPDVTPADAPVGE